MIARPQFILDNRFYRIPPSVMVPTTFDPQTADLVAGSITPAIEKTGPVILSVSSEVRSFRRTLQLSSRSVHRLQRI